MKNTSILLGLAIIVLLTGCNQNDSTPASTTDSEENLNCVTLCYDTIPELCADDIANFEANDVHVMTNNTVYNDEYCEAQCAGWTPEMMKCVNNAKNCDQIGMNANSCTTNEPDSPFEYNEEHAEVTACSTACNNYAKCASFTAGATAGDVQEAYNSCYSECQGWSPTTIACMSKHNADSMQNCMNITNCGLNEYRGMVEEMTKNQEE